MIISPGIEGQGHRSRSNFKVKIKDQNAVVPHVQYDYKWNVQG